MYVTHQVQKGSMILFHIELCLSPCFFTFIRNNDGIVASVFSALITVDSSAVSINQSVQFSPVGRLPELQAAAPEGQNYVCMYLL